MDKMRMETPDLTQANIEKLAALFPACVTEAKGKDGGTKRAVNFKLLRQMLSDGISEDEEVYEFTWAGKKAAIAEANRPVRKTLRPCPAESENWDNTENLYIEGDNLDTLKLLQESYLGKVKLIYIDPPYNTGSDFIYRDNFAISKKEYGETSGRAEKGTGNLLFQNTDSNGRFHSDWCSMMYSRLMLARNLLRDDGAILINIDEHEFDNLQKLCAEIFGKSNDLGTIVWDKRNPKGDARGISCQHEYILVYAKNKLSFTDACKIQRPKKNAAAILKKAKQLYAKRSPSYSLADANADFSNWIRMQADFSGGEKAYRKIDEDGEVYRPVSMAWPNKKKAPADYFIPLIHPVTGKPCPVPERGWRNPSATMRNMLAEGKILFGKDETTIPNSKYLLKENMYENIPSLLYYGGSDTDLLARLGIPFETPKVVSVIQEHIASFTEKEDIVLDFFSGSATTAHAVMQQNAEDGGRRKFILVQLPEPCDEKSEAYKAGFSNICEIGKARIRRAGEKILRSVISEAQNIESEGSGRNAPAAADDRMQIAKNRIDAGFRVFKLDDSNMTDVYYSPAEYDQAMLGSLERNIKPDRSDLDLLFGCLLEQGLPLSVPCAEEQIEGCAVHVCSGGDLIACFSENIPDTVIREIARRRPRRAVFRDSGFWGSPAKINAVETFQTLSPRTSVKVL